MQVGNIYPVMYAKNFFDGMKSEGQENIVNLLRCAWAGSQKYGALVWSGDIASSFASMRNINWQRSEYELPEYRGGRRTSTFRRRSGNEGIP